MSHFPKAYDTGATAKLTKISPPVLRRTKGLRVQSSWNQKNALKKALQQRDFESSHSRLVYPQLFREKITALESRAEYDPQNLR